MNHKRFVRTREREVYRNRWITLFDDDVVRPDGGPGTYVRLAYRGSPCGVVVVPQLPDGRVMLLRVERYAIEQASWEFPRGSCDRDESAGDAALRELQEETGLAATECDVLGCEHPDGAILTTQVEVVRAHLPADAEACVRVDEDEAISGWEFVAWAELWQRIADGKITDGFTLGAAAIYHATAGTSPGRSPGSGRGS